MTEPPTGEPCDRCGREMEVLRYEERRKAIELDLDIGGDAGDE